jgi:linoleoyl-CoA desaturase
MNDRTIIAPPPIQPRYRYKIHDKLYDLTDFVKIHPGGQDMFNNLKPDTNITPMIYAYHKNPKSILVMLPKYEVPSTDLIKIEYDTNYTYDKYCELKKLVYDEIHEKKIPLYWSNKETAYNSFMLSVYLGIWTYCFYYADNLSYWWMVLLGLFTGGFGLLLFHETSHYCGFKNQPYSLLYSQYFPFTNMNSWKHQHNYLHHSFTDTDYDCDLLIDKSHYIRYSNTKLQYNHRFQFIYIFFGYILASLFSKTSNYFSISNSNKIVVLLMLYYLGLCKLLLFYIVLGFNFLFVANLSHIQHECIQINTENKNDFLYNQVSSSMNYRTDDPITRFICIGLDIQIEHHLFPNVPHSSLRQIQHIVRGYCEKHDIPYIEKPSIFPTIYSYICYLHKMGNP